MQGELLRKVRHARRRQGAVALLLVMPLLIFIIVIFMFPLASMLMLSIENSEVVRALPQTTASLAGWDRQALPDENAAAALVGDLRIAAEGDRSILGNAAKRLNLEVPGLRSLLLSTARSAASLEPPFREALAKLDPQWGTPSPWIAIKANAREYTDFYFLSALDLRRDGSGSVVQAESPIFLTAFWRTFYVSLLITLICLFLGYPVAFLLSSTSPRVAGVLMFFVLLPFWTSILVRTTAWIVLLQKEGVINGLLLRLGLIASPLELLFRRPGMIIAMVHVMLPFMILPLYGVMKGISPQYMKAARSLGGSPLHAFLNVYLPMTYPGIGAGAALVFILTIGYYVTPQLIGGPKDQLISSFIASYVNTYLNWGLAAALSTLLLITVFVLFFVMRRYLRLDGPVMQ